MSGGGGYNGYSSGHSTRQITEGKIKADTENALNNTEKAEFEAEVNEKLKGILSNYNERDTDLVNERLNEIRDILSNYLESSIDIRRAGSWSKHTYVDGVSDVDCLFILNSSAFTGESPNQLLDELEGHLQRKLQGATVERGNLSLKVTYATGPELQILPALKNEKGLRIPSGFNNEWSRIINPERFANTLTETNQKLNGNLIPVVKLVKGVVSGNGFTSNLKGYHIEALAVEIFQGYEGERTRKAMLEYFFTKAHDLVKKPMKEMSGQSQYIDDYLGNSGSSERESVSGELKNISEKMTSANKKLSADDWFKSIGL